MAAIHCPVCGSGVNELALHCPDCGADPRLPADEARADLLSRGLTLPVAQEKRTWSRRRRFTVAVLGALAVVVVLTPLWVGYFGPEAAVYGNIWRPWRSDFTVSDFGDRDSATRIEMQADYRDPWADHASMFLYYTVERPSSWLPWRVTQTYTGP